jgi:flavin-dependent dehydrogenase
MDSGRTVRAAHVVDAAGRSSSFAVRRGAIRRSLDRLVAFRARYAQSECGLDRTTLVEAYDVGWFYSSPLTSLERVVLFFTDGDLPVARRLRSDSEFDAIVDRTSLISDALKRGSAVRSGTVGVVPATTTFLTATMGDGWIAAGDAAATLDPLSSLGVLKSIIEAHNAASVLIGSSNGDLSLARTHLEATASAFKRYLAARHAIYRRETRWPTSPFWKRRHQEPFTGPSDRSLRIAS